MALWTSWLSGHRGSLDEKTRRKEIRRWDERRMKQRESRKRRRKREESKKEKDKERMQNGTMISSFYLSCSFFLFPSFLSLFSFNFSFSSSSAPLSPFSFCCYFSLLSLFLSSSLLPNPHSLTYDGNSMDFLRVPLKSMGLKDVQKSR